MASIVFTISEDHKTADGVMLYKITTRHSRGAQENTFNIYPSELYKEMSDITECLNLVDYGVTFEVE